MIIKKRIIAKTSFKGIHCWPEASQFAGKRVKFLESPHRHTFFVTATLSVEDSDREVEFFIFQEMIDTAINQLYGPKDLVCQLGRKSCEQIAEEIIGYLRSTLNLTNKIIQVEVWEDNEVGARIVDRHEE